MSSAAVVTGTLRVKKRTVVLLHSENPNNLTTTSSLIRVLTVCQYFRKTDGKYKSEEEIAKFLDTNSK